MAHSVAGWTATATSQPVSAPPASTNRHRLVRRTGKSSANTWSVAKMCRPMATANSSAGIAPACHFVASVYVTSPLYAAKKAS